MDASKFNLRHLRGFAEISATANVTEAAARVAMSQPALTQAIGKLEGQLSHRLFDRRSNGLYLTEAGEVFLTRVESALNHLQTGIRTAISKTLRASGKTAPFEPRITMTQLRAFLAVAETRNYLIAARQAGLTQPSIHRAAKDLEQIAGFQLYTKTSQGIGLTAAAQELADKTSLMFAELRHGVEELESLAGIDRGQITIGSLPLARSYILPKAINALLLDRPQVSINVRDELYSDLLRALRIGELDMIIGALRDDLPVDDVEQTMLFSDPLAIIARPDHPLCSVKNLTWQQLAGYTWVLPQAGAPTRNYFDRQMANVAGQSKSPIVETSSLVMIRGLLVGSDRLTISSAHQIEHEEKLGLLIRLDFGLQGFSRKIGLTTRVGWKPTKLQAQFFDILKAEGANSAARISRLLKK